METKYLGNNVYETLDEKNGLLNLAEKNYLQFSVITGKIASSTSFEDDEFLKAKFLRKGPFQKMSQFCFSNVPAQDKMAFLRHYMSLVHSLNFTGVLDTARFEIYFFKEDKLRTLNLTVSFFKEGWLVSLHEGHDEMKHYDIEKNLDPFRYTSEIALKRIVEYVGEDTEFSIYFDIDKTLDF